jgi:isoamylase
MTDEQWNHSFIRCIGIVLVGFAEDIRDYFGQPVQDDTFMLLFNAHHEPVTFVLAGQKGVTWERLIATNDEAGFLDTPTKHSASDELELVPRSVSVFKLGEGSQEQARSSSWKQRPQLVDTKPKPAKKAR